MDFTELDSWLGTLEELQLGLENNTSVAHSSLHSCFNKTFVNDSTRIHDQIVPRRKQLNPTNNSRHQYPDSEQLCSTESGETYPTNVEQCSRSTQYIVNGCSHLPNYTTQRGTKDEHPEYVLNSLLRDLEAVEERTRKLEQGSDTFTRRYSLASSPKVVRKPTFPKKSDHFPVDTNNSSHNGYVSAQWAAKLNNESNLVNAATHRFDMTTCDAVALTTSPPASLGAGDACLSSSASSFPNTTTMQLLEQTEAGLWCLTQGQQSQQPSKRMDTTDESMLRLSVEFQKTADFPSIIHTQINPSNAHPQIRPLTQPNSAQDYLPNPDSIGSNQNGELNLQRAPRSRSSKEDDDTSLSGISSWSPCPNSVKRDMIKSNSLAYPVPSTALSNSFSPESSLSEKSLPDHLNSERGFQAMSKTVMDGTAIKKLIIRIFRPDKTTKAILIDESMTAGEVASVLIQKNFLQPSVNLVLVEKVPGLKVERIFEEHENVAQCILAWTPASQNMLFFEERKEHYGFMEDPATWLGAEFGVNLPKTPKTIQSMLKDIEQSGFPERRDHLYIRKPRDKTWTRKCCVLRSSGLYVSRKNKLPLSSADLKRIVTIEDPIQLYTTTGGWTRLHSPTPHGFVLKPFSAQDNTSPGVYFFCATDERCFRQWITWIRMAKYGKQLHSNYHEAVNRVNKLVAERNAGTQNGHSKSCLIRKSSFNTRPSSTSSSVFSSVGNARNLNSGVTFSPIVSRRVEHQERQQMQ